MNLSRRTLLGATATACLARPGIVRAATQTTLRFIPVIDLAFIDPIYAGAQVSRNHGFMVFDTLYGINSALEVSPQMVEGHAVADDGKQWDLTLRPGLLWHDGDRVLARDCVASIGRWSRRDAFGAALMRATDELSAPDDRTIRFRLKRPFPLLPMALGKAAVLAAFMMPERLANQDPFKPLDEAVGSGPFRFVANERVPGARNVYAKFEDYKPREAGTPDWTSGPKVVNYDRVVWTTMPDAGTGVSALQTGEQDWQETFPHDLAPVLARNPGITVRTLDPRGYTCMLRLNHTQAPFDNPAVRRAVLGAVDQVALMTAVVGDDPAYRVTPVGVFPPGTPMASPTPPNLFGPPRDMAKVRDAVKAAGYNGEKVVVLVPTNSTVQKPLGDVVADMLQQAGMNVDYAGMDFGSVLQRQQKRDASDAGGWSCGAGNWQGIDCVNPAGHPLLAGDASTAGWYRSEAMEALRNQWLASPDLAGQQGLARDIQALAWQEVPFLPLGEYKQPTAYRNSIAGVLDGTAVFWNVRPA